MKLQEGIYFILNKLKEKIDSILNKLQESGIDKLSVDEDGYLKIDTGIIADSFNGHILDLDTNNTNDTWVPVLNGGKIQHRVIPQGQEFISSKFTFWGNSCSKDDFTTGFVIVSNYLYVVWFAGTAQVGVVGILANGVQRAEGSGSATLNNITFTRDNNQKLTVTSSTNETIRIIG